MAPIFGAQPDQPHNPNPTCTKPYSEAIAALEQAVLRRLVPRGDEGDEDRGLILEVRAGTGGDEASLFAGEVFGMYERFARRNQWRFEVLSSSKNEFGGLKEAAAAVQGSAAYPTLKVGEGLLCMLSALNQSIDQHTFLS